MWREDYEEDVRSYWMTLRKERILDTERGSTRWHSVKNSLWKMDLSCLRLRNECMNEWMNEWMNAVIMINPAVFVTNSGRKFKPNFTSSVMWNQAKLESHNKAIIRQNHRGAISHFAKNITFTPAARSSKMYCIALLQLHGSPVARWRSRLPSSRVRC